MNGLPVVKPSSSGALRAENSCRWVTPANTIVSSGSAQTTSMATAATYVAKYTLRPRSLSPAIVPTSPATMAKMPNGDTDTIVARLTLASRPLTKPTPFGNPSLRAAPIRATPTRRLKTTAAGAMPSASEAKGLDGM